MSAPLLQADLSTLLRLLDDETPEVRQSVLTALHDYDGDLSEALIEADIELIDSQRALLSSLLQAGRRDRLLREWVVPSEGLVGLHEDWDHCESMMRVLSDFLHDGLSIRQPLGDALDLLAEESESLYHEHGAKAWLRGLFHHHGLQPGIGDDLRPACLDLAAVAAGHPTQDTGAGIVAVLLARRIGAPVTAIDLPHHLVLVCDDELGGSVHDPRLLGEEIDRESLVRQIRGFPRAVRLRCSRPASPGELLRRLVDELATTFSLLEQEEDGLLMEKLLDSLES